jgi:NADPH:quinone reductase-like Zn-dependent oxidoreductase
MPQAVRFDRYGDIDVLKVVDVERPVPGPRQVLVEVRAAAINPGEAMIRKGVFAKQWPATFPSGEGSDLAGVVAELGAGAADGADATALRVGDEVIGFTNSRASHAKFVVVEATDVIPKPRGISWEVAGSLFVAGTTAYAAVRAVSLRPGDTVVVSGASGGVGTLAVQLAGNAGAKVIGLASEKHHDWLEKHGTIPLVYGDGAADRIRAAAGRVDAFIDAFGGGYVKLALDLGISPSRIDTIIDFAAAEKYGVQTKGNADVASGQVLAELAKLVADGRLEVPIARVYPLSEVQAAYRELEQRHTLGKIVLRPD